MIELNNKIVIITGAAGDLGRALTSAFISEGAKVIGLDRNVNRLLNIPEITNHPLFSCYQIDISNSTELNLVIKTIVNEHERIDYLFNNAVVYPTVNFLEESADDFSSVFASNVFGFANCCKAVLPTMIQQRFGRIFNIGSWADIAPVENNAAYAASKGANHALTKAIAKDIEHKQVDVQIHEWIPGANKMPTGEYVDISPSITAHWAVSIAKLDSHKKNTIFEKDQEWTPPKSLKQKIQTTLFFWKK